MLLVDFIFIFLLTVLDTQTPLTWCEWQRNSERRASRLTDSIKVTSRTLWDFLGVFSTDKAPLQVVLWDCPSFTRWLRTTPSSGRCLMLHQSPNQFSSCSLVCSFPSKGHPEPMLHVKKKESAVHSCISQSSTATVGNRTHIWCTCFNASQRAGIHGTLYII